jgi:hypothetical protein
MSCLLTLRLASSLRRTISLHSAFSDSASVLPGLTPLADRQCRLSHTQLFENERLSLSLSLSLARSLARSHIVVGVCVCVLLYSHSNIVTASVLNLLAKPSQHTGPTSSCQSCWPYAFPSTTSSSEPQFTPELLHSPQSVTSPPQPPSVLH